MPLVVVVVIIMSRKLKGLLQSMHKEASLIQNYNFRHFFIRKTQEKMDGLDLLNEE